MTMHILSNIFSIFWISFIFHGLILSIIKLGFFGEDLKLKLNIILKEQIYLIPLISFLIFIISYLSMDIIHLDPTDNVKIKATLEQGQVIISGTIFSELFEKAGSVATFIAGARIAAGLLAKKPLLANSLVKTGTVLGFGAGSAMGYKMVSRSFNSNQSGDLRINTGPIEILVENSSNSEEVLNKICELHKDKGITIKDNQIYVKKILNLNHTKDLNSGNNITTDNSNSNIILEGDKEVCSNVIKELDKVDPNWKDSFNVNSPIEKGELLNPILMDNLQDNYLLHFIILYLLFMLVIIFTCKLILKENHQFPILKKLPKGNLIQKFFTYYITIWQKSSVIWIYLILFFLIVFNSIATFSLWHAVNYLNAILN
uniref:Uncharacterized protein n=1 Tax=Amanita phalloides TaxID=67723 RepID=A0A5Q0N286_AMAPH|nr:hypothetical protein [Amanita phalloides]QFZ98654.1 hypothetical protein [Amanita phalloides]WLF85165.1 hypothetical protein [Amanita phalloides]